MTKIRNNGKRLVKSAEDRGIQFSIIVCDESAQTKKYRDPIVSGCREITMYADSVVFMSATPIMINEDNLYNQLHLLDANIYDNSRSFWKLNLQLNAPFVNALSLLHPRVRFQDD